MRDDLKGTSLEYRREILRCDLIEARKELGLSQRQLGAEAGVLSTTVRRIEMMGPSPWSKRLLPIADALGIDITEYGYDPREDVPRGRQGPKVLRRRSYERCWFVDFGAKMQQARIRRGIRQCDLAKDIPVPVMTLANWERGYHCPSARNLAKWCAALGEPEGRWMTLRDYAKDAAIQGGRITK